jgi:formyl-CoA transferase
MYPCAPGGPNDYVYVTVASTRMWDQFCVAIDRHDLLVDPRFETGRLRQQHAAELDAEVSAWTRRHTKFEAMRLLCEGGVAASAIFDTMDVFNDPHLNARGFFQQVNHPAAGRVTLMSSPLRMSESSVPITPAPLLGADTESVLVTELGLGRAELDELLREGAIGVPASATA